MATLIDYSDSPVPVRQDLIDAHVRAWDRLAAAGTWFTGAQRVALAAETRQAMDCAFCRERKDALSPYSIQGVHERAPGPASAALPEALVDVVHRVRTDATRVTERFFRDAVAAGVSDAEYVEALGVMATVTTIDGFRYALGLPPFPLPAPRPGEPSRKRPAGARSGTAWVPLVAPADVTADEAGMYDGLAGMYIHQALSLVPAEVVGFFDIDTVHYLPDSALRDFGREYRDLTHAQIEFLAAKVSAINQCVY